MLPNIENQFRYYKILFVLLNSGGEYQLLQMHNSERERSQL